LWPCGALWSPVEPCGALWSPVEPCGPMWPSEVVGPLPASDVLAAAWRRSGGDMAAAANIVLDGQVKPASDQGHADVRA